MILTVFSVQVVREERNDKGKILGRKPMGRLQRFFFTNEDGTPADAAAGRAKIRELEGHLPPNHTLEIVEKQVEVAMGQLGFQANCPKHGKRDNEFFCGLCGERLTPEIALV